jgi:hypothetical protein
VREEKITMDIRWTYFQFQKSHGYPVYIRFQFEDLDAKLKHLLGEMGFESLDEKESKKIPLHKAHTRILTVQKAGPRIQMQLAGSDLLDTYGLETLSIQGGVPIISYRRVGLLALPPGKVLWDLALSQNLDVSLHEVGIRVLFARFLAQALSEHGVISYWGFYKEGSLIVTKQGEAQGESVIVDFQNRIAFYPGGAVKIGNSLKILRRDKDVPHTIPMRREELISFLSVNTCLLSFQGISPAMKKSVYDLTQYASGAYAPRLMAEAAA